MDTKLSMLIGRWEAGDRLGALRIAAKFHDLGDHQEQITRGWAAHTHPDFYRSLGDDPDALVQAGYTALAERYGLRHA